MPEAIGKGIASYISSVKPVASTQLIENLLNLLVVESLAPLEAWKYLSAKKQLIVKK